MTRSMMKKSALALAALSVALGPLAPAFADGRHHRGHHGSYYYAPDHHYSGHHYYGGGHYYGSRHYRRHHHHGGLSGGEAALLAAGIIGGIILIDRAIENDRDREYARNYDPYRGDRYGPRAPSRDFYYRRDERGYSDDEFADDRALEDELAGGGSYGAAGYNYGAAYNDCKAETRDAAGDSGLLVALPARPRVIDPIDGGAAVRFTADVVARDINGAEYRRIMTCEADSEGVRFLELA